MNKLLASCCIISCIFALNVAQAQDDAIFEGADKDPSSWRLGKSDNSEGELSEAGTSEPALKVIKTNSEGTLLLHPVKDISVEPGKTYRFSAKVREVKSSGDNKVFLMVSFPGAERKPFPVCPSISPQENWDELQLEFTTKPDEYRLRIHLCVSGGEAELLFEDVKVLELN